MRPIAYTLLLILLFFSHKASAHEVALNTESQVMLYNDAYGADIKYVIVQKFDDDDLAAFVDILEDGVFRFKVNVTLYSSNNELQKITGWLEKVNCVVFLRANTYENGDAILHVHSAPDADSDYTSVKVHVGSDVGYVVHCSGDWYYVVIENDGELYQGWISRYCPHILNSCT